MITQYCLNKIYICIYLETPHYIYQYFLGNMSDMKLCFHLHWWQMILKGRPSSQQWQSTSNTSYMMSSTSKLVKQFSWHSNKMFSTTPGYTRGGQGDDGHPVHWQLGQEGQQHASQGWDQIDGQGLVVQGKKGAEGGNLQSQWVHLIKNINNVGQTKS